MDKVMELKRETLLMIIEVQQKEIRKLRKPPLLCSLFGHKWTGASIFLHSHGQYCKRCFKHK